MVVSPIAQNMDQRVPTNPIALASAKSWLLLLGLGGAVLLAGIVLIIVFVTACDRVVYANTWEAYPAVDERIDSSWPGRQLERRIPKFHSRACKHGVADDGPMRLGDALHAGFLPCTDCLDPAYGRAAEPEWFVAGNILSVAGLGGIIAALAALLIAKSRKERCPRCGCRRTLNFCSTCGGKLTTAVVQPMRQ